MAVESPLQPLRDAVRDRLKALGGWQGLDDARIMLGLDMAGAYIADLERELDRLSGFAICSLCGEKYELYQSSLTGQIITREKARRKAGVVWEIKPPPQKPASPRQDDVLSPRLRGGF